MALGIAFAICVILDEGGGSFERGWDPGLGYLSFFGIFMLPVLAGTALLAGVLSLRVGAGIVTILSVLGLGALVILFAVYSTPKARLERIAGCSGIPELVFEQFTQGHTYSDGTCYRWVVRCSPAEATELAAALGLKPIPPLVMTDEPYPMLVQHESVRDVCGIFQCGPESMEFYESHRGLMGGYSPGERRFRLFYWSAIRRNTAN